MHWQGWSTMAREWAIQFSKCSKKGCKNCANIQWRKYRDSVSTVHFRKGVSLQTSYFILVVLAISLSLSSPLGPSQASQDIGRNSHFKISGYVNIELSENSRSGINKFPKLHQDFHVKIFMYGEYMNNISHWLSEPSKRLQRKYRKKFSWVNKLLLCQHCFYINTF